MARRAAESNFRCCCFIVSLYHFKVGQFFKVRETLRDFFPIKRTQAVEAEIFDVKRSHYAAEYYGAAQVAVVELAAFCDVTHETAGKRIAGPRRVEHGFKRIGGS